MSVLSKAECYPSVWMDQISFILSPVDGHCQGCNILASLSPAVLCQNKYLYSKDTVDIWGTCACLLGCGASRLAWPARCWTL